MGMDGVSFGLEGGMWWEGGMFRGCWAGIGGIWWSTWSVKEMAGTLCLLR